jgi:hypothetical protein
MYKNSVNRIEDLNQKPIYSREPVKIDKTFFGPQRGLNFREKMLSSFTASMLANPQVLLQHFTPEDIVSYVNKLADLHIERLENLYAENSSASFVELD